jgi:serine protease Do
MIRAWLATLLLVVPVSVGLADTKPQEPPKFPELNPRAEEALPAVFSRANPETVEELKAIEDHVAKVVKKVMPSVVCVQIGAVSGSGVIISKDGYVLTAAHVNQKPDLNVVLILHDGTKIKGKTLGAHHGVDNGLIKITQEGDWPVAEVGKSSELKAGQWCMVCSHPGGYKKGRTPPVRLGRVVRPGGSLITTDCCMVGGDSGGPLFDMHGRVIGINSRIGQGITANMHTAVDVFRTEWDRMVKGEVWGGRGPVTPVGNGAFLGVNGDPNGNECRIVQVGPGSPAEKAGIKADDVIVKCDGKALGRFPDLVAIVQKKKPNEELALEIKRGEETLTLKVTLGKR